MAGHNRSMAASSEGAASSNLWDAIVVGAGPAGCAAAYDLAALGRRVLLLDRASFPRTKACAGGLTMKAVHALRYPIDPVVRLWVRSIDLEGPGEERRTVARRSPACAMTVREELDHFCLGKTLERGAQFQRIASLQAIERSVDRVTVSCSDGRQFAARFVIGADGVHSAVRSLCCPHAAQSEGGWFRKGFALEANVAYRRKGEQYPLVFDFAPERVGPLRGYGWLFPRDNHVNVGLYTEDTENRTGSGVSVPTLNRARLDAYIAARCGAGCEVSSPVGQFLGFGAAAYLPPANTRVLLVGDAAGFVDPLTGEGIYGAIRSGQAAASAVQAALSVQAPGSASYGFIAASARLRDDLQVAEHAAARFYAKPETGFQLLRLPLVPRVVLHAYAEGLSLSHLLRGVRLARRLLPGLRSGSAG
jgi:geranylgeranyl reductase family protein